MPIGSAFSIGRSALAASQLGLQVASNNLANAATPGYSRQVLGLEPIPGSGGSISIGRGVSVSGIRRQVDEALLARLNGAISTAAGSQESLRILAGIETTLNELSDLDLSSELGAFFASFSELANGTQSQAQVIEQGDLLAGFVRRIRTDLVEQRGQIDARLGALVANADQIAGEIASINEQVARSEAGGQTNNPLRDRRDELVRELSGLVEVTPVEQAAGTLDVLVGSSPIVLGARSLGLTLRELPSGDTIESRVAVAQTGLVLSIEEGEIGGVLDARDGELQQTIDSLDTLAATLIFELNRLHSTGASAVGLSSTSSALPVGPADRALALNDPLNRSLQGLRFPPTNGGFLIRTVDTASGAVSTTRVDVDLDGLDASGAAGFADDTSLEDLAGQLDAVAGLSAAIGADGRLQIQAAPGTTFSFGEDTSGVLAVLGVNSYFAGRDGRDIAVRDDLRGRPNELSTGRFIDGAFVENATALDIADLQERGLDGLSGQGVTAFWRQTVQTLAVRTGSAETVAQATALVRDGLEGERLALSGVDTDEESLNLLAFQRQYQGAARIISTTNQLLDELLALV
jgi:flagellar hook-associated protein 1 FlgK